ncbi:hypothetical protein I6F40_07585 [Pseudoalteromonas sp. SWXJ133]|jgi:hypothetical protein|uniref:hypothetical protein n=1 Tax=unclassified Pseudoalteromonas TaxID=194690 RepID=UPI00140D9D04|nr:MULTISPECIES: hypothetical protein [unclassified Pseudoalteromonas]MBH0020222.1 hypothetical protein [Pseudoalteromonas sp. SWXJ133]
MHYEIFGAIYTNKINHMNELYIFYEDYKVEVLARLPFFLSELVELFTANEFYDFIEKHGGKKIYLGKHKSKLEMSLKISLTESHYRKLCSLADSSGYIEIPNRWGIFSLLRKIAYENSIKNGMANDELIRVFGISQRTISTARKRIAISKQS